MPDCPAVQIENKVIELILLAGIEEFTAPTVKPRELPELLEKDPPVFCVVVVGNDRLEKDAPKTNVTNRFEYPVLVMIAKKTSLTQPKADPWKKEARYAIRNILYRSFLLGSEGVVRRCHYDPNPEFTAVGFTQGFKYSGQLFVYGTEENRAA